VAPRRSRVDPDRLEALNSEGRHDAAIELGEAILALPAPARRRAMVRYELAMAYLQSGEIERGEALLATASAYFETARDAAMVAECKATEAGLACMRQQPQALGLAKEALAACRRLAPIPAPLEVRVLNYLASVYVTSGEWQKAVEAYEEAIERAGTLIDMRRRARLFNDAAIAYGELKRLDDATAHANKAMALFQLLHDTVSLARLSNNLGLIWLARGDLARARDHLERSLALCDEAEVQVGRSHVLLSFCELTFAERRYPEAFDYAQQGLAHAEAEGLGATVAEAHLWLGRAAEALSQPRLADAEFEQACELFARLRMRRRLLDSHQAYAEILEARGDLRRAYAHLKTSFSLASPSELAN
jgi:tetratricopeptide (TPR) repeat protein